MSCSSGNSSGGNSQPQTNSGSSDEDLQQIMDIRKRKRMISNRESARRSRMRKQKHLDDMLSQVNQLREENNQILSNLNLTTRLFLNVESENSVLRAQLNELTHRLKSLNDIVSCLNGANNDNNYNNNNNNNYAINPCSTNMLNGTEDDDEFSQMLNGIGDFDFLNPWNLLNVNQPIMASPDVFMY
ncbi:OLC1v1010927C1 [Oldenlandia corymbosa var. corymbosa]|uniref:OLC1v1010927C1 n=1 Tax=Oldenlandia corymbosa var. corymbosa TaxID=529605 RepID=A0AAV1DVP1_OLDCO|nr:OLC1v1010927C1 [Oldenlandia corymbosa var. corymbosa]